MDEFKITFARGTSHHDMKVYTKVISGKSLSAAARSAEALVALKPNGNVISVEYVNPVLAFYGIKR